MPSFPLRRFERIYDDVEPVEQYRPGGYHPICLNDVFKNGRYTVVAKLAYGQYSTVWLARDNSHACYIALKVLKASASKDIQELNVLSYLSSQTQSHPGKKYVLDLLDHFQCTGPNGIHTCLIFPLMGADLQSQMLFSPNLGIPYDVARSVTTQIVMGLEWLHSCGVVHGDLQPANIMSATYLGGFTNLAPPILCPVIFKDGVRHDSSAPPYLVASQQQAFIAAKSVDISAICIGDLGGASLHCVKTEPVTPRALRAPELIEGGKLDYPSDIWNLGCLIYQLVTNQVLFSIDVFGDSKVIDGQHKKQISDLHLEANTSNPSAFDTFVAKNIPADFPADQIPSFTRFLRSMLQVDPNQRVSALQLLEDPWLGAANPTPCVNGSGARKLPQFHAMENR